MHKVKNSIDVIAITVMGILAFGLQIPTLGFFQDDWNFVFYSSARGAQGLLEFLLMDGRPGATWVYILGFALLGYRPALWQFLSILLRILTAINVWMILNSLWPRRRYSNLLATILFLTYPFFTLQPLSVAYAPHFTAYFLYSLSILLMMKAAEKPARYLIYSIPALLATFLHLFTVEYFVGLELLRPLFLWFLIAGKQNQSRREALRQVFVAWLPYLLILIFFAYWRSFFLAGLGLRNNPLSALFDSGKIIFSVARNVGADLVLMLVSSWFKLIDPDLFVIGPSRNFYLFVLTILVGLCFYFLLKPALRDEENRHQLREVFLVGALIIVRGNDPLERHLTGGIVLDGKLSEPMLKSIFDPHSPGHDGAVIVEQDRITRFAAHLPLSKNLRQLARVGTRHSAALGLAELADALCLVVSEERGSISIARDGKLRRLENIQELGTAIQEFLQEKFPSHKDHRFSLQLFRENWIEKAVAIALAIAFWYIFVPGSKTVEVSYEIPVMVENVPSDLRVEDIRPREVKATFSGPRRAFYLFDAKKIKVTLDVSLAELGRRTFNISEQNIRYPKDITLQDLTPSTVKLSVKKAPPGDETNRG